MLVLSQPLKFWLKISALVALTGIAIALTLMISEDVIVSVMLIALILLFWPMGFLIKQHLQARAARTPSPESKPEPEAKPTGKETPPSRPSRSYKHLESGAVETVEFLRRHRAGAVPGSDAIYNLPWFLIAGPPSSGKSSLMLSA